MEEEIDFMLENRPMLENEPFVAVSADEKGPKIKIEELKEFLESRSGNKPVMFVAITGPYQKGKTSTIKILTGNMLLEVGDGLLETTKGVQIDGPYSLDYLIERFDIQKSVELGAIQPDIYFIDIEGFEGFNTTTEAYQQFCVPFVGIAAVNILMMNMNEGKTTYQTAFNTYKLAELTTDDPDLISNMKYIIMYKECTARNFRNISSAKFDIFDNNEMQTLKKDFYANDMKREMFPETSSIDIDYAFLTSLKNKDQFQRSFEILAEQIIRNIESAAQSKLLRDVTATIDHMCLIYQELGKDTFKTSVSASIREQSKSTIQRLIDQSYNNTQEKVKRLIDEKFHSIRTSRDFNYNQMNAVKTDFLSEAERTFKDGLIKGLSSLETAIDSFKSLMIELERYFNEKEQEMWLSVAPDALSGTCQSLLGTMRTKIFEIERNLMMKEYYLKNVDKINDFTTNIKSLLIEEGSIMLKQKLGNRFGEFAPMFDKHVEQMQGMATLEINDLFKQAYRNHSKTESSTIVQDDPRDGRYFIIVQRTIEKDPTGKVIRDSSEQIGRKEKPVRTVTEKVGICNLI